jgi:hypothetical protein
MTEQMIVNPNPLHYLSYVTTPVIVMGANKIELGGGTAFFYCTNETELYLVTNWHVVTGRNPLAPTRSRTAAIPTHLQISLHPAEWHDGVEYVNITKTNELELEINSLNGESPHWLEHPFYRHKVNVIVIEINKSNLGNSKYLCVNKWPSHEERYVPAVMSDVYVIGYPYGLTGGTTVLPLYKRGNVSSEPRIDNNGLPRFPIDCRTSPSMSGSPVIASHSGLWNPNGKMTKDSIIGTVQKFVGIYSGRLYDKSFHDERATIDSYPSEIGIVWHMNVINDIIEGKSKGTPLSALL